MSQEEAIILLKNTNFKNRMSVAHLHWKIDGFGGITKLPLGHYTFENIKVFCYLDFITSQLPEDPPYWSSQSKLNLIYLKCQPANKALPKAFHELGQLCLSSFTDAARARPTHFMIVVTPARKVFAICNPLGLDPEEIRHPGEVDNQNMPPFWYQTRPISGKLVGFNTPSTAFVLTDNINKLCNRQQLDKALDISEKQLIILPKETTLRFTGLPT